ncbi:Uncharacterized protein Adt_03132 [Abeliophyllum distichum]|uniref:Uncharacterized protein n=1 Tax=Abeliophyllum distichum TaxID=126358 RepID=A0ABD1VXN2_9LAMI
MEFLIVDTYSTYHGVLGNPMLKNLQAVTSIHHLAMKFPKSVLHECTPKGGEVQECSPTVMTIQTEPMDIVPKKIKEDIVLDEGLDLRIIGSNSLTSSIEELETYLVNHLDSFRML